MAPALCRRGSCDQRQESGNTKLWGEAPAQIDPSGKGAFRGEAAQRNGRGITRGGTDEQLVCAENQEKVDFKSQRALLRNRAASGWFSGRSLGRSWVSLLTDDNSREGRSRNTND